MIRTALARRLRRIASCLRAGLPPRVIAAVLESIAMDLETSPRPIGECLEEWLERKPEPVRNGKESMQ